MIEITEKVFVDSTDMATFVCPKCERAREVNVKKYKNAGVSVKAKVKCKCGYTFKVLLERRSYFRKKTNLPGVFICSKKDCKGNITVKDISRSGIRFTLNSKPDFKIGDNMLVKFNLDNQSQTLIKKEIVIKNIKGLEVGSNYFTFDPYDTLGQYILSNTIAIYNKSIK